jgi:hypothetical protein
MKMFQRDIHRDMEKWEMIRFVFQSLSAYNCNQILRTESLMMQTVDPFPEVMRNNNWENGSSMADKWIWGTGMWNGVDVSRRRSVICVMEFVVEDKENKSEEQVDNVVVEAWVMLQSMRQQMQARGIQGWSSITAAADNEVHLLGLEAHLQGGVPKVDDWPMVRAEERIANWFGPDGGRLQLGERRKNIESYYRKTGVTQVMGFEIYSTGGGGGWQQRVRDAIGGVSGDGGGVNANGSETLDIMTDAVDSMEIPAAPHWEGMGGDVGGASGNSAETQGVGDGQQLNVSEEVDSMVSEGQVPLCGEEVDSMLREGDGEMMMLDDGGRSVDDIMREAWWPCSDE